MFNEAVCNCHEDSVLLEVIGLVEKVYMAQTQKERILYGLRLQRAIKNFLDDFVHHMEQVQNRYHCMNIYLISSSKLEIRYADI